MANPNNPTGTLAPAEDVRRLIEQTPPDVVLVMDEAYIEFLEKPLDLIPLVLSGEKPNLILHADFFQDLRSGRLAPGLRHCPSGLYLCLEKIRQPFNINSLAQAAGWPHLTTCACSQNAAEQFRGRKFLGIHIVGDGTGNCAVVREFHSREGRGGGESF